MNLTARNKKQETRDKKQETTPWYLYPLQWLLLGLAHLPLAVLYGVARLLYWLMAYAPRYRRAVVLDNLRHAFPGRSEAEIQDIARRFYWHFAQVLVEILKLAGISAAELNRRMYFSNPELLGDYLAAGRTVLVYGSHLGNWEWILSGAALLFPGRIGGVYKSLQSPFFEHFTRRLRTRLGAWAVPMPGTLRYLVQHRGQGQELSLLIDQAAGPDDRPYWTDFMHREAGFYTSAERLAVQFQAVVLYVGIRRQRRGHYEVYFRYLTESAAIAASVAGATTDAQRFPATEAFVRELEADIRAAPEQYLWTHRRWKHKRNG